MSLIALLLAAALAATDPICTGAEAKVESVRQLRLQGELSAARGLAEKAAACTALAPEVRVALYLELAAVLDREALHRNTLAPEALQQIEAAAALVPDPAPATAARIELARAEYHYRAEERKGFYPLALLHAEQAVRSFQEAGDRHGEADAVHRLGLVRLKRGEIDEARTLFERALELDDGAGSRPFFRGEHDRYAGFVLYAGGDVEAALPLFESSRGYYRQAGAVDESLFAAITYASALIDAGRPGEAPEPLVYALMVAEKLDSPAGKSRTLLTLGEMYEKLEDPPSATQAYELAAKIARTIADESVERQAIDRLRRLTLGQ
jgi:tetratricopeptide (TPR) repeat protein